MNSKRVAPPPAVNRKQANDIILVISSTDMGASDAHTFSTSDPPPTVMTVPIKLAGLSISTGQNIDTAVYLRRYMLDAIWRDTDDPSSKIAPNSGTSISKNIYVTFFVGPIENNIRLINNPLITPTSTNSFDYVIIRQTTMIGENALNPYGTIETNDVTTFFENQYTNQAEYFAAPGELLGYVSPQAMAALKSAGLISVRMVNDRDDTYRSPFWYYRFLAGVSLWNPDTHQYDVVAAETERIKYHTKVSHIAVADCGGPYFPRTLYTLSSPLRLVLAPFVINSTLTDVKAEEKYCYYLLNRNRNVTMNVTQVGVEAITDLSNMSAYAVLYPSSAPSDYAAFVCPILSTSTGVITNTNMSQSSRFQESIPTPNGMWRAQPLQASTTKVDSFYSCFPWECSLSAPVLRIINETVTYDSVTHSQYVIPRHNYIFMDGGSDWNEETVGSTNVTIGERALQFDLQSTSMVNRIDLIFPRSTEDYQPIYFGGTVQREIGTKLSEYVDVPAAIYFGGFQSQVPCGTESSRDYRYLNTLSQSSNTLSGSSTTLFTVDTDSSPSEAPYSGTTTSPVYKENFEVEPSGTSFVKSLPNDLNPSLDYKRLEFGPFVRGALFSDLEDVSILKAIIYDGQIAEWSTRQYSLGHYFTSLNEFCSSSPQSSIFLQGKAFVLKDGVLASPSTVDFADNTITKYIYPINYNSYTPSDAAIKRSFTDIAVYILEKYTVYLVGASDVNNPSNTDVPLTDYVVKETFYPSPYYDQNDETSLFGDTIRPQHTVRAQKMVNPGYACGRYVGITFGSALGKGTNARMSRGRSNQMRAYAVRLNTQLFNFKTNMGVLDSDSSGTSHSPATFEKVFEGGVLKTTNVLTTGQGFRDSIVATQALFNGNDHIEQLITFDDPTNLQAAAKQSQTIQGLSSVSSHASLRVQLQDDMSYEPVSYVKASSKSVLHRSAEFHLLLQTSSSRHG